MREKCLAQSHDILSGEKGGNSDRRPGESNIKFDTSIMNMRQANKRGQSVPYSPLTEVCVEKAYF